ncbi:hypothetical protein SDC9_79373 [bioreactor metagenome]|uniref:Uncharacterized protein n=1 Tax=bioreactor metagenome TaxID=1076179 RepID=A0A644YWR4_9ZZZZ
MESRTISWSAATTNTILGTARNSLIPSSVAMTAGGRQRSRSSTITTTRSTSGSPPMSLPKESLNPLMDLSSERAFGVNASINSSGFHCMVRAPLPRASPTRVQLMRFRRSATRSFTVLSAWNAAPSWSSTSAISEPRTSSWLSYCQGSVRMTTYRPAASKRLSRRFSTVDLPPPQGL